MEDEKILYDGIWWIHEFSIKERRYPSKQEISEWVYEKCLEDFKKQMEQKNDETINF